MQNQANNEMVGHLSARDDSTWRRWASVVAFALALALGCETGASDGEGEVPTAGELHGLWSAVEQDQERITVWRFAASLPQHADLAEKSNVYELYQYGLADDKALVQRGTYSVDGEALITHVVWDNHFPCNPKSDVCLTNVGGTFSNEILGFTKKSLILQSKSSATGRRTYSAATSCPAPLANGQWKMVGSPLSGPGYGDSGFPTALVDAKDRVHLMMGTANDAPLRHAVRGGCGWTVDQVSAGPAKASEFVSDGAGLLHGIYADPTTDSTVYARQTDDGWQRETVGTGVMTSFQLDADGAPMLLAPSLTALRFARRTAQGWSFETIVESGAPIYGVAGLAQRKNGELVVIFGANGVWSRATRTTAGVWTVASEASKCSSMRGLSFAFDGELRALCGQAIVHGGIVSKEQRFSYARTSKGVWKLEFVAEAVLANLTHDGDDHAHLGLVSTGTLDGTNGFHPVYAHNKSGDWQVFTVGDSGGLIWPWFEVGIAVQANGRAWLHFAGGFVSHNDVTPFGNSDKTLEVALPEATKGARVRSIPAGIDCPGNCSAQFSRNSVVRLLVDLEAPHGMAGSSLPCEMRPDRSAKTWECRANLFYKDAKATLVLTPAPVLWAGLLAGSGDDRIEDVDVGGADVAFVGSIAAAAGFGDPAAGLKPVDDAGVDALVAGRIDGSGAATSLFAFAATRAGNSPRAVALAGDGSMWLGLTTTASLPFDKSAAAAGATVVRLGADGTVHAVKALLVGGGGEIHGLSALDGGDVLVHGAFAGGDAGKGDITPVGGLDAFISRLGPDLTLKYFVTLGTAGNDAALIDVDAKGNVAGVMRAGGAVSVDGVEVETGLSGSGSMLFGLSPSGQLAWHSTASTMGLSAPTHMARTADGGMVVSTNNGINIVYRYDNTGKSLWEYATPSSTTVVGLDVGDDGRILLVGTYNGGLSKVVVGRVLILSDAGKPTSDAFSAAPLDQPPSFGRWGADGAMLLGGESATGAAFGPLALAGQGGQDGWLALMPEQN